MIGSRLPRTILLGVRSLALHKLRSTLTALGIIFGVASVISMLSIGEGASYEAQEEIKKLGSHNIILKSIKPDAGESVGAAVSRVLEYGLKHDDVDRIRKTVPTVEDLVPMRIVHEKGRFRDQGITVQAVGTTPSILSASNLRLDRGRFLVSNDLDTKRAVCVIGADVARQLFVVDEPLSNEIKVGTNYYSVVGVMQPTGAATGTGGAEADDRNRDVYIPLTTLEDRYGEILVRRVSGNWQMERVQLHQVIVQLASDQEVPSTAEVLRGTLKKYHQNDDFHVLVPLELLLQKERTKRIFNIVLGSIAAISLLVGGIGIMNIMLATVTERTREIGVRRALGAKRQDIIAQFLVETLVLSTSGGLFGIVLGIAIAFFVETSTDMKTIVTPYSLFLSFGISVFVGVTFGLYPARRAANLDPIDALRRE